KSQKRQGERRYWSIMLRTRACLPGSKPANIGRSPAREAFMAGSNELRLAVLEGDGIGPEITDATIKVLQAAAREARLRLRIKKAPIGWPAYRKTPPPPPHLTPAAVRRARRRSVGPHVT